MSISELYKNKTVAILNAESVIGRVLLKKLLTELAYQLNKIVIIDTHIRN